VCFYRADRTTCRGWGLAICAMFIGEILDTYFTTVPSCKNKSTFTCGKIANKINNSKKTTKTRQDLLARINGDEPQGIKFYTNLIFK
jgi:hypothetical protein